MTITAARARGRAASFFFMHLGSLVAVVVYFHLCGASGYSLEGVRSALLTALVVKTGYMALAYWQGEHKHFDFGIWTMFAVGTTGAYLGLEPVFQRTAILPPTLLVEFVRRLCNPLPQESPGQFSRN